MESILNSIKKLVGGIEPDYKHFDVELILNINTVLMILNQMGVGNLGFVITGDTETWVDFLGDITNLEGVKTYIYLKVKLIFDPPTSSFVLDSIQRQIVELEWRLYSQAELDEVAAAKLLLEEEVI